MTADEIARSEYLRRFGRFEVGSTTADGETWTGRYLFGRRTYIEIFGPTDIQGPDGAVGSTGIGLSTRHRGDLAMLTARIKDADPSMQIGRTTRKEEDQDIAWFDHLSPPEATQMLEVWVMEFLGDPSDLELRDAAFEKWAQERSETELGRRTPSLREVCSVELDAITSDIVAAEPLLNAAGFTVTRRGDCWSVSDTQMTITLNGRAVDVAGLRRIEFALGSAVTSVHVETLGFQRSPSDPALAPYGTSADRGPRPDRAFRLPVMGWECEGGGRRANHKPQWRGKVTWRAN